MLDLTIVIVNYDTGDLLRECLRSLFGSEGDFTYQVTVVDNHSQDGSAALVRREFPQVDLLENPENVGYAQANSQGLKCQKARYYLLLNPDTVLPPGALRGMLSFMEEHPQAGIAGPKLMMADGRLIWPVGVVSPPQRSPSTGSVVSAGSSPRASGSAAIT